MSTATAYYLAVMMGRIHDMSVFLMAISAGGLLVSVFWRLYVESEKKSYLNRNEEEQERLGRLGAELLRTGRLLAAAFLVFAVLTNLTPKRDDALIIFGLSKIETSWETGQAQKFIRDLRDLIREDK